MPSKREQVIGGVVQLFKAALPQAEVGRNVPKPEKIGPHGSVVVSDGEPGEPEITFSPIAYIYEHRIAVEVAVNKTKTKSAETVLDEVLGLIGSAVEADLTLGGLCDHIHLEAPVTDELVATGAVTARWAEFGLIAVYSTPNPLT